LYREALGYVLASDITSDVSIPPFPASIKDGYAVLASDGKGKRAVIGASAAGDLVFFLFFITFFKKTMTFVFLL